MASWPCDIPVRLRARRRAPRSRPLALLLTAALAGATLASAPQVVAPVVARAQSPAPVHGGVVPDLPRRGWPQILDGTIAGADRVGNAIVYGGTFTRILLPDGSTVTQRYLAAFDLDTGAFLAGFRPVLNADVLVVEAGDAWGTMFVGGRFTSVNGVLTNRLAKLDLAGQKVAGFRGDANGYIYTMSRTGRRLFLGGEFGKVRGAVRTKLAEVDTVTGAVSAAFTLGVTGSRSFGTKPDGSTQNFTGSIVRAVRVTPDGTRLLVVHRGDQVGGLTRWGAAVIDVSGPTPAVTPWQTHLWDARPFNNQLVAVGVTEADLSPDGSMFAVTNLIGNFPPWHDTTIGFPLTGADDVQPLWVSQDFDSGYGVAVSDAAVYVGGHFCWVESAQSVASPFYWPGPAGNQYSCQSATNGAQFQPQTTFRYHVAAFDLPTGRALDWNPGSNNSRNGVQFLRTIDRGLLLGHDGTKVHNFTVGRAAFFDRGVATERTEVAAPVVAVTSPTAGQTQHLSQVTGTGTDDYRVRSVDLRIRDVGTGQYVQGDGSLAASPFLWSAALGTDVSPGAARTWSVTGLPAPSGPVLVQARSTDFTGRASLWTGVEATGGPDTSDPTLTISSPVSGSTVSGPVPVAGIAVDDPGATAVALQVQDTATGAWLQADGTLAAAPFTFTAVPAAVPAGAPAQWSASLPAATIAAATISATASDAAGRVSPPVSVTVAMVATVLNLARGPAAVATASSQLTAATGAERVVDGNRNGAFAAGSVAHTALQVDPWMQVDLGAVRTVSSVQVWNRTDCCGERLSGARVFLSAVPFASTDPTATAAQSGVSTLPVGIAGSSVLLPVTGSFRYVRVQVPAGPTYLNLAEIEVYGLG